MLLRPPGVCRGRECDPQMLAGVMRRGSVLLAVMFSILGQDAACSRWPRPVPVPLGDGGRPFAHRCLVTRLNSRLHEVAVRVHRGDLFWSGGVVVWDGRAQLDRICAGVPEYLEPDGEVLLVHSAGSGTDRTLDVLARAASVARACRPDRSCAGGQRRRSPAG